MPPNAFPDSVSETGSADAAFSRAAYASGRATRGSGLHVVQPCVAPGITGAPLPAATGGLPYGYMVNTTAIAAFAFRASGIPPGLAIDPGSGLIFGTPADADSCPGSIRVRLWRGGN
jgi:hypothetical protein